MTVGRFCYFISLYLSRFTVLYAPKMYRHKSAKSQMVTRLDSVSNGPGFQPWLASIAFTHVIEQDTSLSQCLSSLKYLNGGGGGGGGGYKRIKCWMD